MDLQGKPEFSKGKRVWGKAGVKKEKEDILGGVRGV